MAKSENASQILDGATEFIEQAGRDIDRARLACHFGNVSLDDLLAVLGRYQNHDGGFGKSLEPDIRGEASNPFATELALASCVWADVPNDHPLLQRTVDYIERTQTEDGDWGFSDAAREGEMAPWFAAWEFPNLNPGCTTAGLLRSLEVGSERLHARSRHLFDRLANPSDLIAGGFYGARSYAMYFLPESSEPHPERDFYRNGVAWWMIRADVEGTIDDSGHFFEYLRSPGSSISRLIPTPILERRLDMLEAERATDGGWTVPYGDFWRPWQTVQNLLILRAFGRI